MQKKMHRCQIKLCGITNLKDAMFAGSKGINTLGFIFYPKSPRYVTPKKAAYLISKLPPFIQTVGVFVNEPADSIIKIIKMAKINKVQLHGVENLETTKQLDEAGVFWYKAFKLKSFEDIWQIKHYPCNHYLLDKRYGLNNSLSDKLAWQKLADPLKKFKKMGKKIILAGGLSPGNVKNAIRECKPDAIDIASGVETSPGKKDHLKITSFIKEVERAY